MYQLVPSTYQTSQRTDQTSNSTYPTSQGATRRHTALPNVT